MDLDALRAQATYEHYVANPLTDAVFDLIAEVEALRSGWSADYAALDDRIGELQTERDEARAAIDRVRALTSGIADEYSVEDWRWVEAIDRALGEST